MGPGIWARGDLTVIGEKGGSTGKQPVASVHPPPQVTTEGERPGGRGRAMEASPPSPKSPEALMQNQGSHEALAIQTKQGRASRRAVAWKCCFLTVSSSRLDLMKHPPCTGAYSLRVVLS